MKADLTAAPTVVRSVKLVDLLAVSWEQQKVHLMVAQTESRKVATTVENLVEQLDSLVDWMVVKSDYQLAERMAEM